MEGDNGESMELKDGKIILHLVTNSRFHVNRHLDFN